MTTLFDAALDVARVIEALRSGTADSGTTTTLVDATRFEADDYFNGGSLFIQSGDNDGVIATITDFANATGTFTVNTLDNAIAANVIYAATQINRGMYVQAINSALRDIGPYTQVNDSGLTVVNDQTEYTLPTGVKKVVRVEVAKSSSADYNYQVVFNWKEIAGKLYFDDELGYDAGNKIRLYYNTEHDEVTSDGDTISDAIPIQRLMWTAAYFLAMQLTQFPENADPNQQSLLAYMEVRMEQAKTKYTVRRLHRDPRLASL